MSGFSWGMSRDYGDGSMGRKLHFRVEHLTEAETLLLDPAVDHRRNIDNPSLYA